MSFTPFMGGANTQSNAAAHAERQKQALIDQGLGRINAIFDGGSYPEYATAGGEWDPSQTYYSKNRDGQYVQYKPPGGGGYQMGPSAWHALGPEVGAIAGAFGGGPPSPRQLLRSGKLYVQSKSQQFKGFNGNFYEQRKQDYMNYAMPQIAQQYKEASDALKFGLANRGLLSSSTARTSKSALDVETGKQRQNVVDQGQGQADALRSNVENARQNAITQLYSTADPAGSSASALRTASSFTAPPAFAPIGNTLGGLVNQYAMRSALNQYRNTGYGGGGGNGTYFAPQNYNANAEALPKNDYNVG